MKMTLIGGGSLRTPYFVEALVRHADDLGINELSIMDVDAQKLQAFGGLSIYQAQKQGTHVKMSLTTDPKTAVKGAQYVVTTLRVGGDRARVLDERVALAQGVIGQETTGPGGFAYALRTIPVMLSYMELVKEYAAPDALVFNFTNPAGLVTQAMVDAGYRNIIGICDNATGMKIELSKALRLNAGDFFVRSYGLNHLSWADQVLVQGVNILPKLMERESFVQNFHDFSYFDRDLIRRRGTIPNGYLYYYYHRDQALKNMLKAEKTRGESILEINEKMMRDLCAFDPSDYESINRCYREAMQRREGSYMAMEMGGTKPRLEEIDLKSLGIPELVPASGQIQLLEGYAGIVFNYITAVNTGRTVDVALNVPNNGSIRGMEPDDVVEVSCLVDRDGAHPMKIDDPDEENLLLMRQVKRYEKLTVQAAAQRSVLTAVHALMNHPLVGSWSLAKALVEKYMQVHADYLKDWQ